jgi:hypothetical protein
MVRLLGRVNSSLQGLYLHRTTQHRKTRTNIHALSGIRTRDPAYERSRPAPQTAHPLDQRIRVYLQKNIRAYLYRMSGDKIIASRSYSWSHSQSQIYDRRSDSQLLRSYGYLKFKIIWTKCRTSGSFMCLAA